MKDFKDTGDSKIKEWLRRYDQEITQLKKMNGINDALSDLEYTECIKDKLDYSVLKRLDTVFATNNPVLNWAAITIVQLKGCLIKEFGPRESDVSAVLLQFGPSRLKKKADQKVSEFYHLW